MTEQDWTLLKLLNWSHDYLKKHGIENPRLETEVLLSETLGVTRLDLYLQFERPMKPRELSEFKEVLKRRLQRVPYQYIFNKAHFMEFELYVDENVLIPRCETEQLVEIAVKCIEESMLIDERLAIIDIGTGSGCIAIALASRFPENMVYSIEICPEAVAIAHRNADRHNVKNIKFICGDMKDIRLINFQEPGKIIISNPPYIRSEDIVTLSPEVRKEPLQALDGGTDGLRFYREILRMALEYENEVSLCLEIGYDQKADIERLFTDNKLENIKFYKDYSDIDRVVRALKR